MKGRLSSHPSSRNNHHPDPGTPVPGNRKDKGTGMVSMASMVSMEIHTLEKWGLDNMAGNK